MKFLSYSHPATGGTPRAGVLQGDRILDVNGLTDGRASAQMQRILETWEDVLPVIDLAVKGFARDFELAPEVPVNIAVPIWEAALAAPLPHPTSFRDFYAFEQHVAAGFEIRERSIPVARYESPVFYFGNHLSFHAPDQPIEKPGATSELDFEMEIAAIIGIGGRDIEIQNGLSHVAGFALLNDWSARDIQRREMSVGLGPAKGKDFATSLGPWIVTTDELVDVIIDGRLDLDVVARINGDEVGSSNAGAMRWSFSDLVAEASRGVELRPGDVIASGTMAAGCLLELHAGKGPWLDVGDEIELESTRLGRLRNRIV